MTINLIHPHIFNLIYRSRSLLIITIRAHKYFLVLCILTWLPILIPPFYYRFLQQYKIHKIMQIIFMKIIAFFCCCAGLLSRYGKKMYE